MRYVENKVVPVNECHNVKLIYSQGQFFYGQGEKWKAHLHHSSLALLPVSKFNCNQSMRYAEYEVVHINSTMLKKIQVLWPWEKVNLRSRSKLKAKSTSILLQLNTPILSSIVIDLSSRKGYPSNQDRQTDRQPGNLMSSRSMTVRDLPKSIF